ncbi:hypothetical protein TNCV_1937331 [Trichonephila clavipes]|nr:hypothetical protein TNCV_1937331 [Trichonephila clavipes]
MNYCTLSLVQSPDRQESNENSSRLFDETSSSEVSSRIESGALPLWSRKRTRGRRVMSLSLVPLKTGRVGERCTLNISRTQTSSLWWGVEVRSGDSSGVVLVT